MIDFAYIKDVDILCDTNIFIDLTTGHLRDPLEIFLKQLASQGNVFRYTNYSIFELFRGQPKKLVEDYRGVISPFDPVSVDENILVKAAELMSLYNHHHLISDASTSRKNPKTIDDGDYILSTTAFNYQNTVILTRNYSDFPRPFFNEAFKYYLEYEKDGIKGIEVYYILRPDKKYADKMYDLIN